MKKLSAFFNLFRVGYSVIYEGGGKPSGRPGEGGSGAGVLGVGSGGIRGRERGFKGAKKGREDEVGGGLGTFFFCVFLLFENGGGRNLKNEGRRWENMTGDGRADPPLSSPSFMHGPILTFYATRFLTFFRQTHGR